ncbi:exonuclease domain-containing protein [Nocardioides marmoraquaticus]
MSDQEGLAPEHQVEPPATLAAAIDALWGRLRLVVVDLETVTSADSTRAIEIAMVTCRGGRRTSSWDHRVNPGVPVDDFSFRIHGITDDDLADEGPFETVAEAVLRRLRGTDGETVIVVAHNAGYDVGVLRHELRLIGRELPDLPVLDTARLARVRDLNVRAAGGKLEDVIAALGVHNVAPHTARGDAEATADAVIVMLERAAAAGLTDLDTLLAAAKSARTATLRSTARKKRPEEVLEAEVDLPEEHTAGHAVVLASTDPAEIRAWQIGLEWCARLRCPYTPDRVLAAELEAHQVRAAVEPLLLDACTAGDAPAAATLLGSLLPFLEQLPGRVAALRWHDDWRGHLDPLGRCSRALGEVACPDCRAWRPCPLDSWFDHLAAAARGPVARGNRLTFLRLNGENLGAGVFTTWAADGRMRLAEATAWLVYQEHRAAGQDGSAQMFARYAHLAGGRQPRLVAAYATLLAAPGGEDALVRAITVCDEATSLRSGNTADGWAELRAKRGQLAGRLTRLQGRLATELDEDGNPVPVRRHHPEQPRRVRGRRFSLDD